LLASPIKNPFFLELFAQSPVTETVVEMAMSAGAPQGKHLNSEGPTIEILPVLSGSFIAG
jgi:hypothetical protein